MGAMGPDFRRVMFQEVLDTFYKENPANHLSEVTTANLLTLDSKPCFWANVKLNLNEVLEIMLPWHIHESDGSKDDIYLKRGILVPPEGACVGEVVRRLYEGIYFDSECAALIAEYNQKEPMTIFLSSIPLLEEPSYSCMRGYEGRLIHVDGLHKMIALYYPTRLNVKEINAYICISQ